MTFRMLYDVDDIRNLHVACIETIDYCNRMCSWCPNSERYQNRDDKMSEECFERVLSELAKVRDDWEFHPYFRNDPFCDPDILRRTRRIKQVFPESFVRLTTNGDALNDSELPKETL